MRKYLLILSALCMVGGSATAALASSGLVCPSMRQIVDNFLNLAGSKPMNADINMGGHNIVNSPGYANISSLAEDAVPKGSMVINVKDFGAKGDGMTDDTSAIQAAINAAFVNSATTAGGGSGGAVPATQNGTVTVFIPSGTYVITGLTVHSHTVIRGAGWQNTILLEKADGNSHMITAADAVNTERAAIEDLALNGNKSVQTGSWDGIRLDNTGCLYDRNYLIRGVYVENCSGNGITLLPTWGDDKIEDVICYRNDGYGIYADSWNDMLSNVECGKNGLDGVYLGGGNQFMVNSELWYNGSLTPNGAGLHVNGSRVTLSNIDSEDNYGDGFKFTGDSITGSSLLATANGKNMEGGGSYYGAGFIFTGLTNSTIQGNSTNVDEGPGTVTQQYGVNFESGNSNLTLFLTSSQALSSDVTGAPASGLFILNGVMKNGRRTLSENGIPVILPPSGTIGNNGSLTLAASLPTVYTSCYMYFPAGAILSGSAAGLYYTVMNSATAGTIYNNTYTGGTPSIPASPSAFVTTGPGAYTQTTGSDITLASITVSGGTISAQGALEILPLWSFANSSNAKTPSVKFGGTAFSAPTINSSAYYNLQGVISIRNRGAVNRQVCLSNTSWEGNYAGYYNTYGSVDTSTDQSLAFTAKLATATDFMALEGWTAEVVNP